MFYFTAITILNLVVPGCYLGCVSFNLLFHMIGDTIFAFGGGCGWMFWIGKAHMSVNLMFFFFVSGSYTLLWEWALLYVALLSLAA